MNTNSCKYSVTHWFQPIYRLGTNDIFGYEALLRDVSPLQASPIEIFEDARENGCLNQLDLISIKSSWELFKYESAPLFINIFPSTLMEKNFISWWDIHSPPLTPIVIELLESEPIRNWEKLKIVTKELRARGVKIAIDDMCAGYSFFQQWVELDPDLIKLDQYFAKNLSTNLRKQKIVKSLINLFSDTAEIIIEGIETMEDLKMAELLGIRYAQGYLLGKPSPWGDSSVKSKFKDVWDEVLLI